MSVVCVCRGVRVCVYEQMLQLYPDERCQKKLIKKNSKVLYQGKNNTSVKSNITKSKYILKHANKNE